MAAAKTVKKKAYKVKVEKNPAFCGIDAAGIQFANGEAVISDPWIAEWYRTHEGYKVEEIEAAVPAE